MNFIIPALMAMALGDVNGDLSAAQSMANRFSNQYISWMNESPMTPYTKHNGRIHGRLLRPYFEKINSAIAKGVSPAQVQAISDFDATIAAALENAIEYVHTVCKYDSEHGTNNGGVALNGYYNELFSAFITQASLFSTQAASKCGAVDGYEGGFSSLSSAFDVAIAPEVSSLCYQTLPLSNYGELPKPTYPASCDATSTGHVQSCVLRNAAGAITATSSVFI